MALVQHPLKPADQQYEQNQRPPKGQNPAVQKKAKWQASKPHSCHEMPGQYTAQFWLKVSIGIFPEQ
jgi:hypothetical protein